MQTAGIVYSGIEHITLTGYGYLAKDFLTMGYLEAMYEDKTDSFEYSAGLQYAMQNYDTTDDSNTVGAMVDIKHSNSGVGLSLAYNKNFDSGPADVLYGSGPFYTSTEHCTILQLDGKGDMTKSTLYYDAANILNGLKFEVAYAKLNRSDLVDASIVDTKIGYDYSDNLACTVVYSDVDDELKGDFKNLRAYVVYKF